MFLKTKSYKNIFVKLLNAFLYALKGLKSAWQEEISFRIEILVALVALPIALIIPNLSAGERAILIFSVILVIIIELVNSAIETVVDRISTEPHPLSGRAKDIASSAVLVSIANAATIWLLIIFG